MTNLDRCLLRTVLWVLVVGGGLVIIAIIAVLGITLFGLGV